MLESRKHVKILQEREFLKVEAYKKKCPLRDF